jgi:hypothetical protein
MSRPGFKPGTPRTKFGTVTAWANRLTDGGEVVGLISRPRSTLQINYFSVSGTPGLSAARTIT